MATTTTKLMTFAEFEQLPEREGLRQELRHGELIHVAPPKVDHFMIQQILRDLLDKAAAGAGRAITYRSGQEIPLPLLNGGRLAVDSIFTPAEG